uniref:Immunoglobulin V-set domain-containing protein n=1 Tax=Maylandia zebra TaxID=106582 RepID=A0A3P9ASL9_9CICH
MGWEVRQITVTQPGAVSSAVGGSVSIKCTTSQDVRVWSNNHLLAWYQQKDGGVPKRLIHSRHFASAAPCSSALGEFIVLRVEHWMTDSCPSSQQKPQKSSSSKTCKYLLIYVLILDSLQTLCVLDSTLGA